MSVDQLIHFNSNEEYERSVFQFVQMTGNMSIKEAKHAMDGLVERTLAKQNFLTYRCGGGRNRQSSVLYGFRHRLPLSEQPGAHLRPHPEKYAA